MSAFSDQVYPSQPGTDGTAPREREPRTGSPCAERGIRMGIGDRAPRVGPRERGSAPDRDSHPWPWERRWAVLCSGKCLRTQLVAHTPCESKRLSSVALLKPGVRRVLTEQAGDQPPAGTGGRGLRGLWESEERVLPRQAEGSRAPAPHGRRASRAPGPLYRCRAREGGCTDLQRVSGANAASPTGLSANHVQKASPERCWFPV